MVDHDGAGGTLDLAVFGAGAAGTYVAYHAMASRANRAVALFERTDRIGGRLRSVCLAGLDHPVELGGMRYLTSHRLIAGVVETFALPTHPFDDTGGAERSFLRGHFGRGAGDAAAGVGYDLAEDERGRAAVDLLVAGFERIVPGARELSAEDWRQFRAGASYRGRRVTDWSASEALATLLSPGAHAFVSDAFGYDSGLRAQNLGDAIEYLIGAGDPTAVARVPDAGMDAIPRALAQAFEARGGSIRLGRELVAIEPADGVIRLRFTDGAVVSARRVVLTMPVPALRLLADTSPALDTPDIRRLLASVEAFPASKLYLIYDDPWWLDDGVAYRLTTDLPNRKVFYFGRSRGRSAVLAEYTDGRHSDTWLALASGHGNGGVPAPQAMVDAAREQLGRLHPRHAPVPTPVGSAFSAWGADPYETGWSFWRSGTVSDAAIARAIKPVPAMEVYLCGDTFSRAQGWVEGALETADVVVERLDEASRA